jgi:hypothetical protein
MQHSTQHAALSIRQVNTGKHQEAIEYFDKLLATHPTLLAALLGRGTANALRGKLVDAVGDFTKAPSSPSSSPRPPTPHHRHDFTTVMTPTPPACSLPHTHALTHARRRWVRVARFGMSSRRRSSRSHRSRTRGSAEAKPAPPSVSTLCAAALHALHAFHRPPCLPCLLSPSMPSMPSTALHAFHAFHAFHAPAAC